MIAERREGELLGSPRTWRPPQRLTPSFALRARFRRQAEGTIPERSYDPRPKWQGDRETFGGYMPANCLILSLAKYWGSPSRMALMMISATNSGVSPLE